MTEQVNALPRDQFAALGNGAGSLDEGATKVREVVGRPTPRWAVLSRARACRKEGAELRVLPGEPQAR